jgi:hypothetical protein
LCLSTEICLANTFQNEPDGFRGIKWGEPFDNYSGSMNKIRFDDSYGGITFYARNDDNLNIGSGVVDNIEYGFWQGTFFVAVIYTSGFTNWQGVHNSLVEKFGYPYQSNKYIRNYNWWGEKTWIMSEYNDIIEKGRTTFYSKEGIDRANSWNKEKAKNGANAF